MIEAVRTSRTGLVALEAYIEDKPTSWPLTQDEASLLAVAPTPSEWMQFAQFRTAVKTLELNVADTTITVRRLEERNLLDVFREITDSTNMRIDICGWRFYQQWTAFRKQVTGDNNPRDAALKCIVDSIREQGFAIVDHSPDANMERRPAKVSVA